MSGALIALIAVFVFGSLLRLPIALAMIASGFAYVLVKGQDVGLVAEQIMNTMYGSYVLLSVPMFILAANVMNAGTISERLWNAANSVVGRMRGGLAQVTVVVSVIFSSMSGSAVADAAGPGMVAIRMMRDVGRYSPGFATAITAAAATIAPIIPPSIPMILYALNANVSVGALFLGGIIPGLLMAVMLMVTIALLARRRNLPVASQDEPIRLALLRGLIPLTLPIVLLGGIWTGIFTPTEAAAVAALYAILLSVVVYRSFGIKTAIAVFAESMRGSTAVMLLIAGAFIINYAVTSEQLDSTLAQWIGGMKLSQLEFLLLINLVFLLLGCLLDTGTLLLVFVPILMPTVKLLNIDPVHFGVMIIVNIMIGLITPPFGMLLFVLSGLAGTKIREIVAEIWPFVVALVAALLAVTLIPETVLWLPKMFGYGK